MCALWVVRLLVRAQDGVIPQGAAQMHYRTKEVSMVGWNRTNGAMPRAAIVLLLAGGFVLGGLMPSRAATPLVSEAGASPGVGVSMPLDPQPGEVIALGRKP